MGYGAFVLLPSGSTTSSDDVAERLHDFFRRLNTAGSPTISRDAALVTVTFDGWAIDVGLVRDEHVLDEAREIARDLDAGKLGAFDDDSLSRAKSAGLASYPARLEISSDDDPDMDHFNDYVLIVEALQGIEGAIAFEHTSGSFM